MNTNTNDRGQDDVQACLREFTRQEREAGTHPAITELHARPKTRTAENRKMAEFLRIERGREA